MKHFSQPTAFVEPPVRRPTTRSVVDSAIFPNSKQSYLSLGPGPLRALETTTSIDAGQIQTMEAQTQPSGVYEAVLPPTETLAGMGFIVVLCVALYWVWENQVVPVSRTKLAISKSRGEVKEYLDELKASAIVESNPSEAEAEMTVTVTMASTLADTETTALAAASSSATEDRNDSSAATAAVASPSDKNNTNENPAGRNDETDRAFERWLFADWLNDNKSDRRGGRQKEPALPILKSAKWNSGDNPVVVAAALMLFGLVFTAATERLAGVVQG